MDFAFFEAFFIFLAEAFAAGSWTCVLLDMVGAVPAFGAFWVVWANIAKTNVHGLDQFVLEDGKRPTNNYFPGYLHLHDTWKS